MQRHQRSSGDSSLGSRRFVDAFTMSNYLPHSDSLNPKGVFVRPKAPFVSSGLEWDSRESGMERVFDHCKSESNGSLSVKDVCQIIDKLKWWSHVSEEETLKLQVLATTAGDRMLSLDEFITETQKYHEAMDDSSFDKSIGTFLYLEPVDVNEIATYQHPRNNAEYLEKSLFPTLRAGLEELVVKNEACGVLAASWKEFPSGHLPDVYSPFCPLEWLADYLRDNNPNTQDLASEEPTSWAELSREKKIELCFHHLDRDGSGYLNESDLLALCNKINPLQVPARHFLFVKR